MKTPPRENEKQKKTETPRRLRAKPGDGGTPPDYAPRWRGALRHPRGKRGTAAERHTGGRATRGGRHIGGRGSGGGRGEDVGRMSPAGNNKQGRLRRGGLVWSRSFFLEN